MIIWSDSPDQPDLLVANYNGLELCLPLQVFLETVQQAAGSEVVYGRLILKQVKKWQAKTETEKAA